MGHSVRANGCGPLSARRIEGEYDARSSTPTLGAILELERASVAFRNLARQHQTDTGSALLGGKEGHKEDLSPLVDQVTRKLWKFAIIANQTADRTTICLNYVYLIPTFNIPPTTTSYRIHPYLQSIGITTSQLKIRSS